MKKVLLAFSAMLLVTFAIGQTNSGIDEGSPYSGSYVPTRANPSACGAVLLYTDDPWHTLDFAEEALQNLGYTYAAHYDGDFTGFETALGSATWDIVIFANDNFSPPSSTFAALLNYVQSGGKLIYHSWISNAALETALGVTISSPSGNPIPIYKWVPGDQLFTIPNIIPNLTDLGTFSYAVDSWYTDPIAPAAALAGYTVSYAADQSGLIVGNGGKTIYQGWMDANIGDADADGNNDQVELYENMFTFICEDLEETPVSNWAVIFGMILMGLFIAYRFVRR